jgi:hypothetical protein
MFMQDEWNVLLLGRVFGKEEDFVSKSYRSPVNS